MNKLVIGLAKKFGYHISQTQERDVADPFNEMQCLLNGIKQPIIFDVGAHHGNISRKFRSLFPDSVIYAFEPFPESFKKLRENIECESNAHVFNFGLSDRVGTQIFNCNSSTFTNSLLSTDILGAETWGEGLLETTNVIEARFETIDTVVSINNIPRIDLLKLDVQGAEPLVVAGALETCKRKMIRLVYTEIIIQPTYIGQKRFDEALATFFDNGFDLYDIYNSSHTKEGRLRQVDAIFTSRGD